METVLLHLSATVFDGGVKCACVGFYVRACGRHSVRMWQRRSVEVVERKRVLESEGSERASEGARASQCTVLNHMLSGSIDH